MKALFTFSICFFLISLPSTTVSAQAKRARVNDAPVITESYFNGVINESILGSFAVADFNLSLDSNTFNIIEAPKNGDFMFSGPVTFKEDLHVIRGFTYIPNPNFKGEDSALISVCDTEGGCDTAYLYFDIIDLRPPVAMEDVITVDLNSEVEGTSALNDYDLDNNLDPASYTLLEKTKLGNVYFYFNGSYYYEAGTKQGIDTVVYTVCDYTNLCDTGYLIFKIVAGKPLVLNNNEKSFYSPTINSVVTEIHNNNPTTYNKPNAFKAYPNPTRDLINITFENEEVAHIVLVNALGQVVKRQQLSSLSTSIDVQDLQNGVYFLTVTTKQGQKTEKIVKE